MVSSAEGEKAPASKTSGGPTAEAQEIKRKLAWRMGFAGLMIVMLLGTLAVFDYLSAPEEAAPPAPRFTEPVPVPKKEITQPLKAPEPVPAAPEASAAPVDKQAAPAELPARPEVAAQPGAPRGPANAPQRSEARATPVVNPPPAVPASPAAPSSAPARTSDAKLATPPATAPATAPAASKVEEAPVIVRAPPTPPRVVTGFALQAGVFADLRRAEALHAKLMLNGIPSTLEARVQVGPFKTREEADAAREKMKGLGIDAVLLTPRGATRR
jgi:DedD protein